MEYRIIHKEQFFIAGISKRITLQFKGENHQLDSLYQKMTEEMKQKLLQINNTEPSGIVNVSAEFSDRTKEGSELTQYLGVATTESSSSFDTLAIPESDWAVFTACGAFPEALQNT